MRWKTFDAVSQAEAEERGVPLCLLLVAPWCPACNKLLRELQESEAARALTAERFVPVLVDKDRAPDLDARYRGPGWPTALLLAPDGAVLQDLPVQSAEALGAALAEAAPLGLAQRGRTAPASALASAPASAPDDGLNASLVERVVATLIETADPVHGGWGARQKFPHPEALHLLLVRWSQSGDGRTLETVLRTLRSMQAGAIHDRVEGGFYRFSRGADWSVPQTEKPLESNAKRMLAYIEAYQALGEERFKDTALGILGWMRRTLLDPSTGAFRAGQDEDGVYANLASVAARARHGAPKVDPQIATDRNAAAVIALLKVAVVLDDHDIRGLALTALDFLLEHLWDREQGAAHYWNGAWNQPGFLRDQGALLRALVEAVHCAGANRYLEPALLLARTTLARLADDDGAFRDSAFAAPRGGRAREDRELVENATFAEALVRLGHLVREPALIASGRAALASFADDHLRFGFDAAAYGRAVDLFVHPPVHITIVGPATDPLTLALRSAALRPYVASRLVQSVDPELEPELLARLGLPARRGPATARAYVSQGDRSYAETSDPHRLPALMARTER
ncbi:MAG: DUF255 domain-containing protein [Planctomycetota bacterium]